MNASVNSSEALKSIEQQLYWSSPIITVFVLLFTFLIAMIVFFLCFQKVATNEFDAFVEGSSLKQPIKSNRIFKDKKEKFNMITEQFKMDQFKLFEYANNCLK